MIELLYTLIALELFTGGGGRILEVGPITIRMVLFSFGLIATLFMLWLRQTERSTFSLALALLIGFVFTHLPALFVGFFKGATFEDIFTDLSPLLYWLIAPFFAMVLQREHMVLRTAQLIQIAAVTMALGYICVIATLATGQINFGNFYEWAAESGEIFFRNESMFFYKGFLYLAIGAIFLTAFGGRWRGVWLAVVLLALILTLTRGFILATGVAGILLLWTMGRSRAVVVALCLAAIALFAVWVYLPSLDGGYLLEQRGISNSTRVDDLAFMVENADVGVLTFGEGFGTYINERLSIENSYLTILWKMGPAALVFWLVPLGLALHYFRRIKRRSHHYPLACGFFFGVVLVYVQTGTNPYLNNPIGLSFVIMAIFSLKTISKTISGPAIESGVVASQLQKTTELSKLRARS